MSQRAAAAAAAPLVEAARWRVCWSWRNCELGLRLAYVGGFAGAKVVRAPPV